MQKSRFLESCRELTLEALCVIYSIDFGEIHQVEINHKYALI